MGGVSGSVDGGGEARVWLQVADAPPVCVVELATWAHWQRLVQVARELGYHIRHPRCVQRGQWRFIYTGKLQEAENMERDGESSVSA